MIERRSNFQENPDIRAIQQDWIRLFATAIQVVSGFYVGTGFDLRVSFGGGYAPKILFVAEQGAASPLGVCFLSNPGVTFFSNGPSTLNGIKGISVSGMDVGTHPDLNSNSKSYFFVGIA